MEISVIITCFNYARYLGRGIRSVYNQSLEKSHYEIIVVNDASTDETVEVLKDYDDFVRVINLDENVGLAEARNIGVRRAMGQFVVFMDADDYVHRDMLLMQYNFLELNHSLDAVAVDYVTVDDEEQHLAHYSIDDEPIACGIMYRKDFFFDAGLYDKNFRAREDEDFRLRFLEKHNIYRIILPLYRYRKHENNMTSDTDVMDQYANMLKQKHD